MDRRKFLGATSAIAAAPAVVPWHAGAAGPDHPGRQIMTVRGPVKAADMGRTLIHEHLLADLRPQEEKARNPRPYKPDEVLEVVLPHLERIRDLGCRTFVDCTAAYLGRDAAVLRRISEESGMQILTVTGNYAALQLRALRANVLTDTVERLARRWIGEWRHGIERTGVRPGLIKLGFDGGPLTEVERKLIRAAGITHLETGLPIVTHISGPNEFLQRQGIRHWSATSALEALSILESQGVSPSAFIRTHVQFEPDLDHHIAVARRGAWLSYDGVGGDMGITPFVDMVMRMRGAGVLHRVLVSQDAGWYRVGESGGGDFRPYDAVFTAFIPELRARGVTQDEINTIFVRNPADAFSIAVRRGRA
jgi:predicted metal-dependent phosphotriesterase family hydrolase